jgi:hypothetical protein
MRLDLDLFNDCSNDLILVFYISKCNEHLVEYLWVRYIKDVGLLFWFVYFILNAVPDSFEFHWVILFDCIILFNCIADDNIYGI